MLNVIRNVFMIGRQPGPRGFVAEWTVTILILFFATTTLVQAYVIPTGSMEGNLLVGDHLLVDKVAYADPGGLGRGLLPYRTCGARHHRVPYPLIPEDICEASNGFRRPVRMENQQVIRNGQRRLSPTPGTLPDGLIHTAKLPQRRAPRLPAQARGHAAAPPAERRDYRAGRNLFFAATIRDSADSRYWGRSRENVT
jgi:signal peptidase I